jgi:hypothetical protein
MSKYIYKKISTHLNYIYICVCVCVRVCVCLCVCVCENQDCKYISCIHCTSLVNEMEWDGFIPTPFVVGHLAPNESSLVCRIYIVPLTYIAACGAPIYYVFGNINMTCACVHLGLHKLPVKAGENLEFKKRTHLVIRE